MAAGGMMVDVQPAAITIDELLERYDGVLLDAYGVLVDGAGALPGARPLILELARRGLPYAVVTNDASRSPDACAARFAGLGIPITADRCFTSGALLREHLRTHGLAGARTLILGTDDSRAYATAGGAALVELDRGAEIDVLAICDDAGYPFLRGIELALSAVLRALAAGRRPTLLLPNPDLVYPTAPGELGFTAGAIALLIEAGIARCYPESPLCFTPLGKPQPGLLQLAQQTMPGRLVMIGDQLETDIAAANAAGIDSALHAGVSHWTPARGSVAATPTWLIGNLNPASP